MWRNILRGGVALAFLFLFIWMSPDWKVVIIEGRIDAAQIIIAQDGETKESLKDASNIWFLEWAMKDQYLNKTLGEEERELYAKIYDRDIESVINTPVDTDQYRTWSSNATSILAHGANAKVDLNFAKHETEVLSDISATRTTVTYEFQNTTNTNQEVIFNIELPNIESAMTDLRLGLNLEYLGAVAPRGAASNVYQDSLKRNMDPALLEQTSPLTYRLRAFPVPSNTDATTQGRQKIQFTYVTPLSREGMITLIPKTTILNLKLTKKSEIITRVMNGDTALEQDSVSGDDLATLQDGKMKKFDIALQKSYGEYCSTNTYTNFDPSRIDTPIKKLTRNIVFFDISKSVGEKSESRKQYQSLIDTWKSNGISLDIYSYNFDIYPSGYDMNSIEFWGNTDMAKVVEYIQKNDLSNANIVIVTDDNSYEKASNEIKTIDYKKLKSNTISLIQVGNKIRTLKTEVTKAILATDGAMISLDEKSPLTESVKQIFMPKPTIGICEDYSGNSLSSLQSLQGYSDGRKVFGEIYSYS